MYISTATMSEILSLFFLFGFCNTTELFVVTILNSVLASRYTTRHMSNFF